MNRLISLNLNVGSIEDQSFSFQKFFKKFKYLKFDVNNMVFTER